MRKSSPIDLSRILDREFKSELVCGDCVQVMAKLPSDFVDAIVTDPPYGLEFMGKEWDKLDSDVKRYAKPGENNAGFFNHSGTQRLGMRWESKDNNRMQEWHERWVREALRVLKPGGYLLAFGGTRTYHRLACAIEDAGFEIRDTIAWMYGTGFPKSKNLGNGWGTALKPAHEPIVVARKPIKGTVAANVLAYGTGGLNIDASRISLNGKESPAAARRKSTTPEREGGVWQNDRRSAETYHQERPSEDLGRWPANVILDEEAAAMLDKQTGTLKSGIAIEPKGKKMSRSIYGETGTLGRECGYVDSGGASRFFYVAKASRAEREAGLSGVAEVGTRTPMAGRGQGGYKCVKCDRWKVSGNPCVCTEPEFQQQNFERPAVLNSHPTVKPVALMRYLVRLVTPPGGIVLDPFVGSGTTGLAAKLEKMRFLGIEKEPEYMEIAQARIRHHNRKGRK